MFQYLTIADHNDLDFTNEFTLSGWFKRPWGMNGLIYKGPLPAIPGTDYSYKMTTFVGVPQVILSSSANVGTSSISTGTMPGFLNAYNDWVHITSVFDGSSMKLFIDGTLLSSNSGTPGNAIITNHDLSLGAQGWWGGNWASSPAYNGQMDEIKIFNKALSDSEVSDLYNSYP